MNLRIVMDGRWKFTSSGDSISGSGSMSADAAGMNIDLEMDWKGQRIGDCP